MDSPAAAKRAIRAAVRQRIAALAPAQRTAESARIRAAIEASPIFQQSTTILGFLGLPEEPDLRPMLRKADASGKTICLPRMDWLHNQMTPIAVQGGAWALETRKHGVEEPVGGHPLAPDQLDLILVPGLAFDPAGVRLGRGGGFYDRFLGSLPPGRRPFLLGVAFACQLEPAVPQEAHDVRIDGLVTAEGLIISSPRA